MIFLCNKSSVLNWNSDHETEGPSLNYKLEQVPGGAQIPPAGAIS